MNAGEPTTILSMRVASALNSWLISLVYYQSSFVVHLFFNFNLKNINIENNPSEAGEIAPQFTTLVALKRLRFGPSTDMVVNNHP